MDEGEELVNRKRDDARFRLAAHHRMRLSACRLSVSVHGKVLVRFSFAAMTEAKTYANTVPLNPFIAARTTGWILAS
jgi:hypothetical protein